MGKIFDDNFHPYTLISLNTLKLPEVKTVTYGRDIIGYVGKKTWNSVPKKLKKS